MNDSPSLSSTVNYGTADVQDAPVLIAGTSHAAIDRARRSIEQTGRRIGATGTVGEMIARVSVQPRLSTLWIEADEDSGDVFDALLERATEDGERRRFSTIVATRPGLIDRVAAFTLGGEADLLIEPSLSERVAALAIAEARLAQPPRVADAASDRSSTQLRQLSDEVNRIAATLARLSTAPVVAGQAVPPPPTSEEIPVIAPESVRSVIRARRLRNQFFAADLFADPAWDMLLDLLQAELAHLRVPVSSLCIAAAVPATTALRWIKTMVDRGLFVRRADPFDGRRVFVELAPDTSAALHRYFAEVDRAAVV